MAIDNAVKRRSAAGTGCVALLPGATPDATAPTGWRRSAAWSYSGVPSGEPVAPTGGRIVSIPATDRGIASVRALDRSVVSVPARAGEP